MADDTRMKIMEESLRRHKAQIREIQQLMNSTQVSMEETRRRQNDIRKQQNDQKKMIEHLTEMVRSLLPRNQLDLVEHHDMVRTLLPRNHGGIPAGSNQNGANPVIPRVLGVPIASDRFFGVVPTEEAREARSSENRQPVLEAPIEIGDRSLSDDSEFKRDTKGEETLRNDPCNLLFDENPRDLKVIPNYSLDFMAFQIEFEEIRECPVDIVESIGIGSDDVKVNTTGILGINIAHKVFEKMQVKDRTNVNDSVEWMNNLEDDFGSMDSISSFVFDPGKSIDDYLGGSGIHTIKVDALAKQECGCVGMIVGDSMLKLGGVIFVFEPIADLGIATIWIEVVDQGIPWDPGESLIAFLWCAKCGFPDTRGIDELKAASVEQITELVAGLDHERFSRDSNSTRFQGSSGETRARLAYDKFFSILISICVVMGDGCFFDE